MGATDLFNLGTAASPEPRLTDFGDTARQVAEAFDYDLTAERPAFVPYDLRGLVQTPFALGVVVGSSGSGKTQALTTIGNPTAAVPWDAARCVADHFADAQTAMRCLGAAGLNSVPQWMKPHHMLSNGERYRADLARMLAQPSGILLIDEFTSVVDRIVARSLCEALRRHAATRGDIVVATCHFDVVNWLTPDWVLDTNHNLVTHATVRVPQPWRTHIFNPVAEMTRG